MVKTNPIQTQFPKGQNRCAGMVQLRVSVIPIPLRDKKYDGRACEQVQGQKRRLAGGKQHKPYDEIALYICRESSTNQLFYAKQTQFQKS